MPGGEHAPAGLGEPLELRLDLGFPVGRVAERLAHLLLRERFEGPLVDVQVDLRGARPGQHRDSVALLEVLYVLPRNLLGDPYLAGPSGGLPDEVLGDDAELDPVEVRQLSRLGLLEVVRVALEDAIVVGLALDELERPRPPDTDVGIAEVLAVLVDGLRWDDRPRARRGRARPFVETPIGQNVLIRPPVTVSMAAYGRSELRDLFDESPTPHIAHPPETHHRDFYVATDGSYSGDGGGLGVVLETRDGTRVARLSVPDPVPDNNVAEYRALHLGLDVLANRAPGDASVGVLVDHDDLAANVNAAVLAARDPTGKPVHPVDLPPGTAHHWRGIEARLAGLGAIRAAVLDGGENPAHPLANTPELYDHVNEQPARCVLPDEPANADTPEGVPPPSRADRNAGD